MTHHLHQSLVDAPVPVVATERPDDLLKRVEVQRMLNISRETLLRWVATGKFPRHDIVRAQWKRWRRSTVTGWLATYSTR